MAQIHTRHNPPTATIHMDYPPLPQLKQPDREDSQSHTIDVFTSPVCYKSTDDETDEDDSSSSGFEPSNTRTVLSAIDDRDDEDDSDSSSSGWEPSISKSVASTYLPRQHNPKNKRLELKTYHSMHECDEVVSSVQLLDNILFYPFCNLQSLLFSHIHPYINADYKHLKDVQLNDEDEQKSDGEDMDWNNLASVHKIKQLVHNLLVSASSTSGIREEDLYLMFTSPSPQQIIEQLRFGILSLLCDVHIDRFGRRSYYRKNINYGDWHSMVNVDQLDKEEQAHFYNHSHIPSALFAANDIGKLSHFITESPSVLSPSVSMDRSPAEHARVSPRQKPKDMYLSPRVKHPSEDKLDWQHINIDHAPVTHLLATHNKSHHAHTRNTSDLSHKRQRKKHKKNKTTHSHLLVRPAMATVPELDENRSTEQPEDKAEKVENVIPENTNLNEQSQKKNKRVKWTENTTETSQKPKTKGKTRMRVKDFKRIELEDVIQTNDIDVNDNYELAKKIVGYFDLQFGDTDTVCLVSSVDKQPSVSFWIKGKYVRKDTGVFGGRYVLVYRASKHTAAKEPVSTHQVFAEYVKQMAMKYSEETVDFICDKLDARFGDGCHFVRSKCKRPDYDVYCRFSDGYECSFRIPEYSQYVVAWRR